MDYKTLYTPTEAATLYNVAKIKYDPTSYSLKGNLITNASVDDLQKEHIHSYDFNSELHLLNLIGGVEPARLPYEAVTGYSEAKIAPCRMLGEASMTCVQQDNLYISLQNIDKNFIPLDDIKSTNVMQTLVTMCIALNSNKSCSKELMFLATSQLCGESFERLHSFEYLKEALKNPGIAIKAINGKCTVDSTYTPTIDENYSMKEFSKVNSAHAVDSLIGLYIGMFEVMWALKKLPDKLQSCFLALCRASDRCTTLELKMFDRFLTNSTGRFETSPELATAISIDDPAERFKHYQNIVMSQKHDIVNDCKHWFTDHTCCGEPMHYLIAAFSSFVMQISEVNIRINTIRILHEYCITKKYMKPRTRLEGASDTLEKKFGELFGDASIAEKMISGSKALKNFEEHIYDGGHSKAKDTDHASPAMFEALDKSGASFKDGGYTFDVTDVIDNEDPLCRDAYNAIASKVDLVNKLLIRRLRDIKTYNVGGKNPGAKSGRIDKKAIHRYKYDPNIFYNNSYKTLESDLAFGIVLDESGSMSGKGIENGRVTMIVLHETLKALGINHSIVGHTSRGNHHCKITRYQSFREDKTYTTRKNYAIVKADAKAGNCDSGALYYMERALDRVRNKDKICLIFSDGAPTECSGTELKQQVAKMEKKGIKVIGIGINFASIAKYYNDYANGRNLSDMLNIVSNILKEYVLKKKDK